MLCFNPTKFTSPEFAFEFENKQVLLFSGLINVTCSGSGLDFARKNQNKSKKDFTFFCHLFINFIVSNPDLA